MSVSEPVTGADLLAAHPLLTHPRMDEPRVRHALETALSGLAERGWTPRELAEAVEDWSGLGVDDWIEHALLVLLFDLARAGLSPREARAWLGGLRRRVRDMVVPTRLHLELYSPVTGLVRDEDIRAYRDAVDGDGLLALWVAAAGLTPAEARQRWVAGALDVAGLELLAGLRGSFSPVS